MNTYRRSAVLALTAAGLLWGTTVPLSKLALAWLSPAWLTFGRFTLAAAVLFAVTRIRASRPRAAASMRAASGMRAAAGTRSAWRPAVLVSGALGYGGTVLLQNVGIGRTSVSQAALLIGAAPVLIAVIAAVWQRVVARPVAWAGFAVSLAGVGLVTGGAGGGATVTGDGLVMASLMVCAVFTVGQEKVLRGRDPIEVTGVQFLGAALAMLPVAVLTGSTPAAPAGAGVALAALGLALGGTVLPFTLFAYGQTRVSAEVAGAFVNIEPLVGAVAGVLLFGDPAGLKQAAGGGAILAGIALSSLPLLTASRQPGALVDDGPMPGMPAVPADIHVAADAGQQDRRPGRGDRDRAQIPALGGAGQPLPGVAVVGGEVRPLELGARAGLASAGNGQPERGRGGHLQDRPPALTWHGQPVPARRAVHRPGQQRRLRQVAGRYETSRPGHRQGRSRRGREAAPGAIGAGDAPPPVLAHRR